MMAPFLQELEQVFGWLLAASWQASVLALAVLLIQRILGSRLNPRWRYALWLLVLLRLVLPVLPESALSLFQFAPPPPAALAVTVTEPLFVSAPPLPAPSVPVAEIPEPSHPFSLYSLMAVIWLAGAMILLVLTWQVNRRFARQVANSPAIADPDLLRLFAEAKAELGIRRAIRLIENGQVQSPAIMGLFQPTLLLPADVRGKFDSRELRFIFLHELAHLKRGDVIVQALIALLQILHWFNPVLWFAFRRMRIDREPATDALVLSRTGEEEKERYGLMLIKLLEHFNQRHSLPTLVGILEDKDQFKRRFSLIARFTRGAYGWSLLGILIIGILAAVCLTQRKHAVDPHLPYVVDLKPFYTKVFRDVGGTDSSYAGYSGRKMIDGLPFDIGGEIVLYGGSEAERNNDHPDDVSGIKIDRKFDELHLVHAAQWRSYYGCPVATVRLHYADGTSTDFTIRDKFQVDDWNRLLTENDELVAAPDTKIIWRGAGIVKGTGRLFKSVLHNPFPDKKVDTMDIISTRSLMSYVLVAATVAQSDPHREVTPPLPLYPSRNFDGTLNVHVVDKVTGKPVAGAEVDTAWIIQDISLVGDSVLTGADGIAAVKYPISDTKDLRVEISKAGYLTCDDNWENGWDGGSVPADMTYKLAPGRDPILDARPQMLDAVRKGDAGTSATDEAAFNQALEKDRTMIADPSVNSSTLKADAQMLLAIQKGDVAALKKVVEHAVDPNTFDPDRFDSSPVYWAVYFDQPEALKLLLDHMAEGSNGPANEYPLQLAQKIHPDLVPILEEGMKRNRAILTAQLKAQLHSIHIDLPAFSSAPLQQVVHFLLQATSKAGYLERRVTIGTMDLPASTTMTSPAAANISIWDALQTIADANKLRFDVDCVDIGGITLYPPGDEAVIHPPAAKEDAPSQQLQTYLEVTYLQTPTAMTMFPGGGTIPSDYAKKLLQDSKNKATVISDVPLTVGVNTVKGKTPSGFDFTINLNWNGPLLSNAQGLTIKEEWVNKGNPAAPVSYGMEFKPSLRQDESFLIAGPWKTTETSNLLISFVNHSSEDPQKADAGAATKADAPSQAPEKADASTNAADANAP
jgi:beta-lactamase regulating signal transducer with metallopeptidase domain